MKKINPNRSSFFYCTLLGTFGVVGLGFLALSSADLMPQSKPTPQLNKVAPPVVALDQQLDLSLIKAMEKGLMTSLSASSSKPMTQVAVAHSPVVFSSLPTALGTPRINVQAQMAQLAFNAHEQKLPTPYNLGSYGCAAAIWEYVTKPALKQAYPDKINQIPSALTHTQSFLEFYKQNKLGKLTVISTPHLSTEKTPPGTVLIGIKKGTGDHHMLVAVDVNWRDVKNPETGEAIHVAKDGVTDAYAGNTGLPQFGKPHFRIQEFAEHLGFLNKHHGAINSLSENNYYDRFIVMTFAP